MNQLGAVANSMPSKLAAGLLVNSEPSGSAECKDVAGATGSSVALGGYGQSRQGISVPVLISRGLPWRLLRPRVHS